MVDNLGDVFKSKPTGHISPTLYRYFLWRRWDDSKPTVAFIMLNPSTADDKEDDPTLSKCIGFAKRWGYGSLVVANLFAYRATNPDELSKENDPIGLENDLFIIETAKLAELVILAWGEKGKLHGRGLQVGQILAEFNPKCLGLTKKNYPLHPLYVPYMPKQKLTIWNCQNTQGAV